MPRKPHKNRRVLPDQAKNPPNTFSRRWFVHALQTHWPKLWHSLRDDVWKPELQDQLEHWARLQGRGILDSWLLEVFTETMAAWSRYPESPQAQLLEKSPRPSFVVYRTASELAAAQVAPATARRILTDPGQQGQRDLSCDDACKNEGVQWYSYPPLFPPEPFAPWKFRPNAGEQPSHLKSRAKQILMRQLETYCQYLRQYTPLHGPEICRRNAEMTVLMLSGQESGEIASTYHIEKQAVVRAVSRFSREIGLTL